MSEWYENIPEEGVLCDTSHGQRLIKSYDEGFSLVKDSLGFNHLPAEITKITKVKPTPWYENIPEEGFMCDTPHGPRLIKGFRPTCMEVIDVLHYAYNVESVTPIKQKPFTVRVNLDVYFEIPKESLPPWANGAGVEQLVEKAIEDYNAPMTLQGLTDLFQRQPAEVSVNNVLIA